MSKVGFHLVEKFELGYNPSFDPEGKVIDWFKKNVQNFDSESDFINVSIYDLRRMLQEVNLESWERKIIERDIHHAENIRGDEIVTYYCY